jgi:hypothetical protein
MQDLDEGNVPDHSSAVLDVGAKGVHGRYLPVSAHRPRRID